MAVLLITTYGREEVSSAHGTRWSLILPLRQQSAVLVDEFTEYREIIMLLFLHTSYVRTSYVPRRVLLGFQCVSEAFSRFPHVRPERRTF